MFDTIKKQFEPKKTWVIIKEGGIGIECFSDPQLKILSKPNKILISSFLEGVIEDLRK